MSVQNLMTAKIIGEIVAQGMSLSEFDLKNEVNFEAISALEEISKILSDKKCKNETKIKKMKNILEERGIY